jgi:RNA-splicing ligase RtcB
LGEGPGSYPAVMATRISDKLVSWASEVDDGTIQQALKASRLPIVDGHVALMPDAPVGSVIPTRGAVIPAAVGVDLGCGMIAVRTDLVEDQLPDALEKILPRIEKAIPAGVGEGHKSPTSAADRWLRAHPPPASLSDRQLEKTRSQFGTLGSGNHFFEICLDEPASSEEGPPNVWVLLHSGSRGIGNQLAQGHIDKARRLVQGTKEFDRYIADMQWAQDYALANREAMMDAALVQLFDFVGRGTEVERINCHHNFTQREQHEGRDLWVTRKGAIRAGRDDMGVIPGSMGTRSYVVRGLGNPQSYESCSHGAGRRLSRGAAKRAFTAEDLKQQMKGKVWLSKRAGALIDEIPSAYKDIDQVMDDQRDLVEVRHVLRQVVNYKGT